MQKLAVKVLLLIAFVTTLGMPQLYAQKTKIINGNKYYIHKVERHETIYRIAKQYDVTQDELIKANPTLKKGLKAGQTIKIPIKNNQTVTEKKKDTPPPIITEKQQTTIEKPLYHETKIDTSNFFIHYVEQGQTFYSLTRKYDISIEKLVEYNPILVDGLKAGQTLRIPKSDKIETQQAAITYPSQIHKEAKNPQTEKIDEIKEDKNKPANPILIDATNETHNHANDTLKCITNPTKKTTYNIALSLPFITQANDTKNTLSTIAYDFYSGILMALDNNDLNIKTKLFVYDNKNDTNQVAKIIHKPEFDDMQLMIGPLFTKNLMYAEEKLLNKSIPIVSPFSEEQIILQNNPNIIKMMSSKQRRYEQLARYIFATYKNEKIILVKPTVKQDIEEFEIIKTYFDKYASQTNKNYSTFDYRDGLSALKTIFADTKKNVVIFPSSIELTVLNFVSKIGSNQYNDNLIVFGKETWKDFENIDQTALNNINYHFIDKTYIDYKHPKTINFIRQYKNKYNTEPSYYAIQGYDIMNYYLQLFSKYGTNITQCAHFETYRGIQNKFEMNYHNQTDGIENKHAFILRYKDFELVEVDFKQ